MYVGPVIKRTDNTGGTRWLRRAESLARRITQPYAYTREVHDGYLVEGYRMDRVRGARVIDPPGQIVMAGRTILPTEPPQTVGVAGFTYRRDDLHPEFGTQPPPLLGTPRGGYARGGVGLYVRDPAEAQATDLSGSFLHGVVECPGGYRAMGVTYAKPAGAGVSYYRPIGEDVFFRFSFSIIGSLATAQPGGETPVSGPMRLGLDIDSEWVEQYLGGGARLVLDASVREGYGSKPPLYGWGGLPEFMDSRGYRWAMPWVVAQPTEIAPDRVVWRVLTRYGAPTMGPYDAWGQWMLATFDVEVVWDSEVGAATASPGPITRYDPFASGDPSRVTELDSFGTGYRLNLFGFPAAGPDGSYLITHVASPSPGSNPLPEDPHYSFNCVLLTPQGTFVEVSGLPADVSGEMPIPCYGKLRSLFFGGARVGDSLYFVNPFVSAGVLALVDGNTGGVTLVPRPTLIIPLAVSLLPGQLQNRMYYLDDMCKSMVVAEGSNHILFPASTASSGTQSNICLVVLNTEDMTVEVRGEVTDQLTFAGGSGGIAMPGVVQREVRDETTGEVTLPAILLWGFHGEGDDGRTYVSLDSGYTWDEISAVYGPARAVWYAGNVLSRALPGALWVDAS